MTQDKEDKTRNNNKISCLYNLCCGVSAIFIVYIIDVFHCLCYGQHFLHVTLFRCLKAQTQKELRIQKLKSLERK